ncbi:diguanylate cyclase [Caminibacter pacificus]|uniref:diguanylate cyclase n=1 Tax=Caminibacter pacificus TaxID=1424653 RepID=A0AAJ4UXI0_9BACT|nr:diguanylate cyclase [Caminibacter pacificus]NPA87549.1 diguanylate cyclase [Campylobacterota bacterium]QCI28894.1 diguanylate cyclase [Caminibacter pacificus]ROR39485.1 diguanylate cyclase (GGDEF)-like protein [Caminibacter pacificus]
MRFLIFFVLIKLLFAVDLNSTQREYLNTRVFNIATTTKWEPFNTEIDGKLVGIAVDYWKLIAKKTGINYKFLIKPTWIEVLQAIEYGDADLALGAGKTKEREKYAVFTKPYVTFPLVIATRNDVGFIPNITFLRNKIIAVGKGYTAEALLKKNYPNLNVISVPTIDEALKMVKEGKVYAAIDILPVIAYKINKYQYDNLKISGQLDIKFPVRFMINKSEKELVPIINKAIDEITFDERENIYKKWITAQKSKPNYFQIVIIIILAAIIVMLIIWVVKLKIKLKYEHEYEIMLEKLASYDKLTGIYNRQKLEEFLEMFASVYQINNEPFSVIFFDVDNFKKINDDFGHQVGDIVLVEISSIIQSSIRKRDIFGRWGGEEFMIILENCKIDEACSIAENIRKKIEKHNFGINRAVTCSFGVSEYAGGDLKYFLLEVDEKLYKAKREGKNRVIC